MKPLASSLLLREVRIVPVHGAASAVEPVDVLIRGGRIAALGPQARDPGARVVHCAGRWLIPGLWDHHVHFAQWAAARRRIDLAGSTTPQEVCRRVAAALPGSAAPVVMGFGYRSGAWGQQPTVAVLDAISDGRPIILISGDAHNGWLNSAALARFGLPAREGALTEDEWFAVWARLPELPRDAAAEEAAYAAAVRAAAALGVVGVTDFELARGDLAWPQRMAAGLDQVRVRVAVYARDLDAVIARGLRTGDSLPGTAGLATMGPLKVITDGSLNTKTAFCCQPYAGEPANHGVLNISAADLRELMARGHAHGFRVAAHAIGDAALASALDAFTASGATGSIEHAQLVDLADLPRMAALGLIASVQPAHLLDDRDVTHQLWPDRTERCFAFASMRAAGITLALGSDAPVAALDPWAAMAAAVHRSADERGPWNAAEALTAREALAASIDSPSGIVVGARGDLALLDVDPLAPQPDSASTAAWLRAIRPSLTIMAGRLTHEADAGR